MDFKKKQRIKKVLPLCLQNIIRKAIKYFDGRPSIIYNIGKDNTNKHHVLFCYVPQFLYSENLDTLIGTREKESSAFVNALLANNCSVDICSVDYKGPFNQNYDYVFGQGVAFRKARICNPDAKSILYLTEMPPSYSYEKEKERADYLYERHQIKVNLERSGKYFTDDDFKGLDGCIMLGKEDDAVHVKAPQIYMIQSTGLKNTNFELGERNIEKSKKNFIWIGSLGAIHKGLDILFDVFARHPEFTLHVLGLQPHERKLLKRIKPQNVIDYGFVQISSHDFIEIAVQCAFMIFPSCSEGVATSVITAMNHGIIPLVSDVCSIETTECGESMQSYYVEDVEEIVLRWSRKSNEELFEQMRKTIEVANKYYTLKNYSIKIHGIVKNIVST